MSIGAEAPTFTEDWRYQLFVKGNGTTMFPFVGVDTRHVQYPDYRTTGKKASFSTMPTAITVHSMGNVPKAHTSERQIGIHVRLEARVERY